MSYAAAIAALKPLVAAVTGVRFVHVGRPNPIDNVPLVYLEADDGERTYGGQIVSNVYRVRVVLVVSRQGQTLAENEIMPFINSLPIAIDANPTLGGACNTARVVRWEADYPEFTEQATRSVAFICEITDKGARGTV